MFFIESKWSNYILEILFFGSNGLNDEENALITEQGIE